MLVGCLPSIQDVLGFIQALPKTGLGDQVWNAKEKEEGLEVQVILELEKKKYYYFRSL